MKITLIPYELIDKILILIKDLMNIRLVNKFFYNRCESLYAYNDKIKIGHLETNLNINLSNYMKWFISNIKTPNCANIDWFDITHLMHIRPIIPKFPSIILQDFKFCNNVNNCVKFRFVMYKFQLIVLVCCHEDCTMYKSYLQIYVCDINNRWTLAIQCGSYFDVDEKFKKNNIKLEHNSINILKLLDSNTFLSHYNGFGNCSNNGIWDLDNNNYFNMNISLDFNEDLINSNDSNSNDIYISKYTIDDDYEKFFGK